MASDGMCVVITGSASGLGAATATRLGGEAWRWMASLRGRPLASAVRT